MTSGTLRSVLVAIAAASSLAVAATSNKLPAAELLSQDPDTDAMFRDFCTDVFNNRLDALGDPKDARYMLLDKNGKPILGSDGKPETMTRDELLSRRIEVCIKEEENPVEEPLVPVFRT